MPVFATFFGLPKAIQNIVYIALFAMVLAVAFGLKNCQQSGKDKALIEHNNQKLADEQKEAKQKVKAQIEIRKLENQKETKLKVQEKVYVDKHCEENSGKNCEREIEVLTPEEVRKRKDKALKELKSNISL